MVGIHVSDQYFIVGYVLSISRQCTYMIIIKSPLSIGLLLMLSCNQNRYTLNFNYLPLLQILKTIILIFGIAMASIIFRGRPSTSSNT